MKKWLAILSLFTLLLAAGCSNQEEARVTKSTELIVFAASSLTEAFQKLAETFEALHQNLDIVFNFGGSGTLQTQITQGAPCDLFASAGQKQMDDLVEQELVQADSVRTFAHNRLVVIAPKDRSLTISGLPDLLQPEVHQISIGDPGSVPVGQYSVEVLTNQQLIDPIRDKLVYGNNVRQVLQYVERGEVELGIVYATDAAMSKEVKVLYTIPEEYHQKITYPVGVVKESPRGKIATEFIAWVGSIQGQKILQEFGFTPVQ